MQVTDTHYKIEPYGLDKMVLINFDNTGSAIALAVRSGQSWAVSVPGTAQESTHGSRSDAIDVMIAAGLEAHPEDGCTTWEPDVCIGDQAFRLRELP